MRGSLFLSAAEKLRRLMSCIWNVSDQSEFSSDLPRKGDLEDLGENDLLGDGVGDLEAAPSDDVDDEGHDVGTEGEGVEGEDLVEGGEGNAGDGGPVFVRADDVEEGAEEGGGIHRGRDEEASAEEFEGMVEVVIGGGEVAATLRLLPPQPSPPPNFFFG